MNFVQYICADALQKHLGRQMVLEKSHHIIPKADILVLAVPLHPHDFKWSLSLSRLSGKHDGLPQTLALAARLKSLARRSCRGSAQRSLCICLAKAEHLSCTQNVQTTEQACRPGQILRKGRSLIEAAQLPGPHALTADCCSETAHTFACGRPAWKHPCVRGFMHRWRRHQCKGYKRPGSAASGSLSGRCPCCGDPAGRRRQRQG